LHGHLHTTVVLTECNLIRVKHSVTVEHDGGMQLSSRNSIEKRKQAIQDRLYLSIFTRSQKPTQSVTTITIIRAGSGYTHVEHRSRVVGSVPPSSVESQHISCTEPLHMSANP
jgi:hypothetical protein